jgi:Spy/CpxP family protein refolding chaperone
MRRIAISVIPVLLLAGMVCAQQPGPPGSFGSDHDRGFGRMGGPGPIMLPLHGDWWKNSEIVQKLNLTDLQKQQIQQVYNDHRANFMTLRNNLGVEEQKLRGLVDQDQPQTDQVLAQVDQWLIARNKLEREFAAMTLGFRKVLTLNQWTQLRQMAQEEMMRRHMRRESEGKSPSPGFPPSSEPK